MLKQTFSRFYQQLSRISRKHILADALLIIVSLYASLYLRVSFTDDDYFKVVTACAPLILLIRLACLIGFGCYQVMWRYISTIDATHLAKAIALSAVLIVSVSFFVPDRALHLPRSVYLIDAIFCTLLLMGARLLRRVHYESKGARQITQGQRTLIYGSGNNGRLLAQRFRSDAYLSTHLIGFVDDDPKKKDLVINGIAVLGTRADLKDLLQKYQVAQLIIAVPQLPGELLREIVQIARPFNIRPRLTTQLRNTHDMGKKNVEIYRDIDLSDLLNRPAREIDLTSAREMIHGKKVLVTGAGGSIGSELARQIMTHNPGQLILLDNSEFNLYSIDNELRLSTHDTQRVVPLMVDLKDAQTLRTSLREYAPEIVFHAAAYKHVHLVESNPFPSILNNVAGTHSLLGICKEIGVQTFVMISTDKAVNPAGVMGGTKRVCELLVTATGIETGHRYCSVRFGNVLGSSGSLIPLLKQQIQDGGPVTVTHADMTRFFMLIPEAVSLVLKAATIAQPGDINVLRMGEPVKIHEIARSLIALMGKTENEIPILFTGLRPGEKMFEELYIRGDELKTEHPDILTLPNGDSSLAKDVREITTTLAHVERMIDAAHKGSKEALFELNALVKSNYVTPPDSAKDEGHAHNKLVLTASPRHH